MQTQMSAPLRIAKRYWGMSLVRGIILIIFGLVSIFWPHITFRFFMFAFGIFAIVEGVILILNAFTQRTVHTPDEPYARTQHTAYSPGMGTNYPQGAGPQAAPRADTGAGNLYSSGYEAAREEFTQGYQAAREEFSHGNPAGAHGAVPGAQPQGTTEPHTTKHRANRGTLLLEGVLTILCGIAALILPTFIGVLALYIIACWALFKGFGSLMQMRARGVVLAIVGILGVLLFLYIIFNPLHFIRAIFLVVGLFALIAGIMMVMRGFQHNAAARRATRPIEPSY